MNVDKRIRYELLARLCPNTTGAEIRSVCTEAGMFAIRARRKSVSEKDMLDAVEKVSLWSPSFLPCWHASHTPSQQVIKGYKKFSSTPKYMVYN